MMRRLLIAFAFLAPVVAIALAVKGANIVVALMPVFFSHVLLVTATLVPGCQWWGPVVTKFQTTEQEVWLTIDDGPLPVHTERMLDLLEQFEARATFFVVGARAEKFPHLITEIITRGHALANHTETHPSGSFWCAGPSKIQHEIDRCARTLRSTPERPALFFRAPVGTKNPFLHPILARRGLTLIGWTARGFDTIERSAARVAARLEKNTSPGAILLLHEGQRTKRNPDFNPRCLELTLQRLSARGYRFVIPTQEQLRK